MIERILKTYIFYERNNPTANMDKARCVRLVNGGHNKIDDFSGKTDREFLARFIDKVTLNGLKDIFNLPDVNGVSVSSRRNTIMHSGLITAKITALTYSQKEEIFNQEFATAIDHITNVYLALNTPYQIATCKNGSIKYV